MFVVYEKMLSKMFSYSSQNVSFCVLSWRLNKLDFINGCFIFIVLEVIFFEFLFTQLQGEKRLTLSKIKIYRIYIIF